MYQAKKGRKITRLALEEVKERFEAQYEETSSREIYARRKARVSILWAHQKKPQDGWLYDTGADWGQRGDFFARTCFNLARMITILGVSA